MLYHLRLYLVELRWLSRVMVARREPPQEKTWMEIQFDDGRSVDKIGQRPTRDID